MNECLESNTIGTNSVFNFCLENKIKLIYSATSATLGNDGNEFKVITQIFLYKFINDKFLEEIKDGLTSELIKGIPSGINKMLFSIVRFCEIVSFPCRPEFLNVCHLAQRILIWRPHMRASSWEHCRHRTSRATFSWFLRRSTSGRAPVRSL